MPDKSSQREMYRYKTKTLTGPWAPTIGAAIDDAIRAGQARVDPSGQVVWVTPGEIERSITDDGSP